MLPGADEFLPALILLVKRANPANIHSNLEFVQVRRREGRGEGGGGEGGERVLHAL